MRSFVCLVRRKVLLSLVATDAKRRLRQVLPLAAAILVCLAAAGAQAQTTLTVNTTADSTDSAGSCTSGGACSLRDAINQANSDNDGDTINFSVTGTITYTANMPGISANVTIQGPGASHLTIDGGKWGRE